MSLTPKQRSKSEPGCSACKSRRLLTWLLCSAACLSAQAQIPAINPNGLVNGATGRSASSIPVAARGSIVSIYGTNFASTTLRANSFPLPNDLGGVQALFGSIPAALLYVSSSQINAQVPFELPDVSSMDLVVQNGNGSSTALAVTLLAQDPGIFSVIAAGAPVSPTNPVSAGESITIWATGLGAVLPAVPSGQAGPSNPPAVVAISPVVKLGGRQVDVGFAGLAPGQVIYQINVTAPADLAAPTSEVTVEAGVIPAVTGPPGPIGPAGALGTSGTNGVNGSPGTAGTNGTNGAPGLTGPPGLNWRGIWSNTTAYAVNDAAQFNGTSYISIQAGTGNEPDISPAFWSVLAQVGAAGTPGTNGVNGSPGTAGTNGTNGAPGAPGLTGPPGLNWRGIWSNTTAYAVNDAAQFNGTSYISIRAGTGNEPDISPAFWSVLAQVGAAGTPGTNGSGGAIAFSDFFALMPPDNSATVAPGTDVSFPEVGPTSGSSITSTGPSSFNLSTIGTYQVMFQVSVSEAGQLILTLNGAEVAYTAAGRATSTSQIVGISLVTTTIINSILTVRNPTANSLALTITPLAGGTVPVSAHLVITQIQ
jgi:uncharacterized protein (TIGR03437 family)